MMRPKFLLLCLLIPACIASYAQSVVIKSHDVHIHYMGRILMQDESADLMWPGTSISINFKGTGVKITLKDEYGNNYYNIIIDGKVTGVLKPDSTIKEYTLASGLPDGNHTAELFKRTEWVMGKTSFYQFTLDKNSLTLPPPPVSK